MSDIVWREMPERGAMRCFLAIMAGPWPEQVLQQTILVSEYEAKQFMLGADRFIALRKAEIERNLRAYAMQIAVDVEARRTYRHGLRGTRGTL